MVAPRGKCQSTLTQQCCSDPYRCLKRRLGQSRDLTARGTLSLPESKSHKLPGAKGNKRQKRFPRPLFKQDGAHSNRQHHSCCLHKQEKRHEVGPSMCNTVENPDLVLQETGNSQGLTLSSPTSSHSGLGGVKTKGLLMQENHCHCTGVAQHTLVLGSGSHVKPDPPVPAQSANSTIQSDYTQESAKPKSPCLTPRASMIKASLRQWHHKMRLLKESQPDQFVKRSGSPVNLQILLSSSPEMQFQDGGHIVFPNDTNFKSKLAQVVP